jgi:hypothetical protein
MTIFPGLDASGNSNNWTENNINNTDSTATTYDIMTDVPTLTDADTANFCVMNPLVPNGTMTNGNLQVASSTSNGYASLASISVSENGNWYCEVTPTSKSAGDYHLGVFGYTTVHTPYNPRLLYVGSGAAYNDGTSVGTWASYTTNDIIGIAYNSSTKTAYFYKNNSLQGSMTTTATENMYFGTVGDSSGTSQNYAFNFGQRPFAYTPPAGYLKLNTFNLPDSSIVDGSEYFVPVTYTGNGGTKVVTTGFQPDLVWMKNRGDAQDNTLMDSVRAGDGILISNWDGAETFPGDIAIAYNSDDFTLTGANARTNTNLNTYVAWNWKAGGTAVSNTDGTITSSVSANTTAGFSVVTYTGTGAIATIGHGLGVAPKMVIVKDRAVVGDWWTWHTSIGIDEYIRLNLTAVVGSSATLWNNTLPTSSVFSVGVNVANTNTETYVAYCFAEVEGYSKIGSYTGNGSTDGPFIYTGFKPAWIMLRDSTNVQNWIVLDTARNTYNAPASYLLPNSSGAEGTLDPGVDVLSNGFKMRTANSGWNTSSAVMIYMAFAENPFKNSLAR